MSFIQEPYLDLEDGQGLQTVPADLGSVSFDVINDFINIPYKSRNSLGSNSNPGVMPNLQASLSRVRARIWNSRVNATPNENFTSLANNPKIQNTQRALSLILSVSDQKYSPISILTYGIYIHTSLTEFDTLYNSLAPAQTVHTADLWTEFINSGRYE
ncbi:fe413bcc-81cd-4684-94dd-b64089d9f75f-CDS [Sclerotinia trifoliorum]|uniref:Fe413bcc-81cd-4684-94dd-b64089d9f75f-CDS n=1 Tax=Sclerotinia trifoliorum TaxID=28548 RepID=A0A8H2ZK89_9HELO|nr:fe413bcc-81cd-4684-94dd-b64089d9f75f-CDS [Sclerotinia trifoliorum]